MLPPGRKIGGTKTPPLRAAANRFEGLRLDVGERPIEPGQERFEIGGFDRGAGPDAQARQARRDRRRYRSPRPLSPASRRCSWRTPPDPRRSAATRGIDDLQADGGVGADGRILRQESDPGRALDPVGDGLGVGVGAGMQCLQAAERLRPNGARRDNPRRTAWTAC